MKKIFLLIQISFSLLFNNLIIFSQNTIEQEKYETSNIIFHLNKIGNIISYKKQLQLMKTGDYILIPKLNSNFEVEYLIRKRNKNNPEDKLYKIYTDGNTILSTKNLKNLPPLVIGDTIKIIEAYNLTHKYSISNNINSHTFLITINESQWTSIKQKITSLIKKNPTINFVLHSSKKPTVLNSYFSSTFIKKNSNVFLADKIYYKYNSSIKNQLTFYVLDSTGNINFVFPTLVALKTPQHILQKYLKSL